MGMPNEKPTIPDRAISLSIRPAPLRRIVEVRCGSIYGPNHEHSSATHAKSRLKFRDLWDSGRRSVASSPSR